MGCLRVAVDATCAADVDYISGLSVLDAEVWGRGSDELEGCSVMQRDDCVPLFVCHLNAFRIKYRSSVLRYLITDFMDHSVPGEAGIVDNDVYLAITEFSGLLHELVDMFCIQHVSRYGNGSAASLFDLLDDALSFGYTARIN